MYQNAFNWTKGFLSSALKCRACAQNMSDVTQNLQLQKRTSLLDYHRNLCLWLGQSLHFHGGLYLNSFAKVNFPTRGTLQSLTLADTVFTFVWRKLFEFICISELSYSRTIDISDLS